MGVIYNCPKGHKEIYTMKLTFKSMTDGTLTIIESERWIPTEDGICYYINKFETIEFPYKKFDLILWDVE